MELESIGVEYMKKRCKLTISILASNRKDTIPKCLESIKPLLEQVDSELIVTDTGCDKDLLEIIRKYTDKIVRFQWCKDFAAARNVGLNMAHGQWFLYVDDDEWFEDVSELIAFFNGEEEKKYECANYLQRNYHSKQGSEYGEWVVGRVFRIRENTKFVGRIHEYVEFNQCKMKQFSAYVHHYGYAFETDEQRLAHSERNVSLLEKEIELDPTNARNYAHIYQEYRANDEPGLILKYTEMAMENVNMKYRRNMIDMCSTYVAILWAYTRMKKYDEVIKRAEEMMITQQMSELTKVAFYAYLVEACAQNKEYDKCVKYAKEYIGLYKMYMRSKERFYMEMGPMLNDVLRDNVMFGIYLAAIESAIKRENIEDYSYFLKEYDWTKGWDTNKLDYLKNYIDMTVKHGTQKDTVYVFGMFFADVQFSKVILNRIQEIKNIDEQGYAKICDIIAKIAGQPGYRSYVNIIGICKRESIDLLDTTYKNAFTDDDAILMVCSEFYDIAIKYKIELGKIISDISYQRWAEMIKVWLLNSSNKDIVRVKKYMDIFLNKSSEHMKILEENLMLELDRRKNIKISNLL